MPFSILEDAAPVVELIGNDGAVMKFKADSRLDQLRRHLEGAEWRKLLDSIPTLTLRDLRDRALIV
jgi:hypothetical protein